MRNCKMDQGPQGPLEWYLFAQSNLKNTHHRLMVDLDHLIPCMDFLTLVCWRLKERERERANFAK